MIIIPSKGRAHSLTTPMLLDKYGIDYKIVLHNEDDKKEYLKNTKLNHEKIVVANVPYGMSQIMKYIKSTIEENEWILKLDDNITEFTAVADDYYEKDELNVEDKTINWDEVYKTKISPTKFLTIIEKTKEKADEVGAKYVGFATTDNHYFRGKKWREVGYVLGKMTLIKHSDAEFDTNIIAMDDYGYTADNIEKYGKVLINNYIKSIAGHYVKGGCGTYEERLPAKLKDCEYLMKKYPKLFRYKTKTGCHPKAELQVCFTNLEQVERWRKGLNIIKTTKTLIDF